MKQRKTKFLRQIALCDSKVIVAQGTAIGNVCHGWSRIDFVIGARQINDIRCWMPAGRVVSSPALVAFSSSDLTFLTNTTSRYDR